MKIIAEIPARLGSKRVKAKNLRLMDGQPLIHYAIKAATDATKVAEVYVNSESDEIGAVALERGAKHFKRDAALATDTTTSDEFNYDFMSKVDADVVVMVNPVAPLISGRDIDAMLEHFLAEELDTLIPVREEKLHAFCGGRPINFETAAPVTSLCGGSVAINFDPSQKLPMTQAISPIQTCVWSVCIWRTQTFKAQFEAEGHAVFSGKVGLYPVSPFTAVKISDEKDWLMAEILLRAEQRWRFPMVPYDCVGVLDHPPAMWMQEIERVQEVLLEGAKRAEPMRVLEWGSGNGTIHFAKFLKQQGVAFEWHAIENFIPWHNQVLKMLRDEGLDELVTTHLKSATCEERKWIQEAGDMSEYVHFPETLGKFDVILVDGRLRTECLANAKGMLKPDGTAILHDAERETYHTAFAGYDGGFVSEVPSPVPGGVQKLWVGHLSQ